MQNHVYKILSIGGGILADEMGLGKTITMISLILARPKPQGIQKFYTRRRYLKNLILGGTLIVCPPSVVSNWQDQFGVHLDPVIPVFLYHGPQRKENPLIIRSYHVVITTYSTLCMDLFYKQLQTLKGPVMNQHYMQSNGIELYWMKHMQLKTPPLSNLWRFLLQKQLKDGVLQELPWYFPYNLQQNKVDDLYSLIKFLRIHPFSNKPWWNSYITKSGDDGMLRLKALMRIITLRRVKSQIVNGKPM